MNDNPHALEWSNFRKNTDAHTLSVLHEDGVYRHLKMAEGDNNFWSWEIVTFPGSLVFRGDIGRGYIFTREWDMVPFFNTNKWGLTPYEDGAPVVDFAYWAEKLSDPSSAYSFSLSKVKEIIKEQGTWRGWDTSYIERVLFAADWIDTEQEAQEFLRDLFQDDFDVRGFDIHFIYACYAVDKILRAYFKYSVDEVIREWVKP